MNILETENLSHTYGKGETAVQALKNVSIGIKQGESVAIMGPSGCGKSTLLHMLGGMDKPSAGRIMVEGNDITGMKEQELAIYRRRRVGFIFQFFNLIPVMTAKENIQLSMALDGRDMDGQQLDELAGFMGIKHRLNAIPSQLSGGEQQRVSIARALAYRPAVVLADEPTGNLDSKNAQEVISLFRQCVKKYNQTFISVTHDKTIASYADRIIYMQDGEVVGEEVCSL